MQLPGVKIPHAACKMPQQSMHMPPVVHTLSCHLVQARKDAGCAAHYLGGSINCSNTTATMASKSDPQSLLKWQLNPKPAKRRAEVAAAAQEQRLMPAVRTRLSPPRPRAVQRAQQAAATAANLRRPCRSLMTHPAA